MKLNPEAGVIKKVAGIVSRVTDAEKDKNGNLLVKIYVSSPTLTEGSIEREIDADYPIVFRQGSKQEGLFARDMKDQGVADEDTTNLVTKLVEIGFDYESFTGKDGKEVSLSYPRLKHVGEREEENTPPLTKAEVVAKLRGLTPSEGVKLARLPGIRGGEFAETVKNKNRVLELGLDFTNGRYS